MSNRESFGQKLQKHPPCKHLVQRHRVQSMFEVPKYAQVEYVYRQTIPTHVQLT